LVDNNIEGLINEVMSKADKRKFVQSIELLVKFDPNRTKQTTFNELIYLPHQIQNPSRIMVIAGGEMALEAKKINAQILSPEELDRLATNKREAKKMARRVYAFVSESSMMQKVGKNLGPILAPRGKMPVAVPGPQALTSIYSRVLASTRIRGKNQLGVIAKVGKEGMDAKSIAENAMAVIDYLDKKLPPKSISRIGFKLTMSHPVKKRYEEVS
jgi:large subunit ribosomal protein L1